MTEKEHKEVATHNGRFHEEVFSCAALSKIFDVEITRTRNQQVYEKADLRVDLGEENDPATGNYDHHQYGGAGVRDGYFKVSRFAWYRKELINWLKLKLFNKKTSAHLPYSSFGLVWKEFGVQICKGNEKVAKLVELWLVIPIDAQDCGYRIFQGKIEGVPPHTVSNVLDNFNRAWDEDRTDDEGFAEAFEFACKYLDRIIARAEGVVRAGEHVLRAIEESDDPRIVALNDPMPWSQIVREIEVIKFVVHRVDNGWMLKPVNARPGSGKKYRHDLPKCWPNSNLVTVSGVADARFCPPTRHFAMANSKEGAILLAKAALDYKEPRLHNLIVKSRENIAKWQEIAVWQMRRKIRKLSELAQERFFSKITF